MTFSNEFTWITTILLLRGFSSHGFQWVQLIIYISIIKVNWKPIVDSHYLNQWFYSSLMVMWDNALRAELLYHHWSSSNDFLYFKDIILRWDNRAYIENDFFVIPGQNVCLLLPYNICGLCRQKQVYQAEICNCIPQYFMGCNYLSMLERPASDNTDLILWTSFTSTQPAPVFHQSQSKTLVNSHDSQIPIGIAASGSRDW